MATNHKIRKRVLLCLAFFLFLSISLCGLYLSDSYGALPYDVPNHSTGTTIPVAKYDGFTVYGDSTSGTAFLFYPGGKVATEAYAPLLLTLAERGLCCVAIDMPFRLAILKPNAADKVLRQMTSIDTWYIGGHSLGGVMASKYAATHPNSISGLILLAAYPMDPFDAGFPILSILGSEDNVLNAEKYNAAKTLMPSLREIVIEGGNHAQFGNYGAQKGDGIATISPEAQWDSTVDEIIRFCTEKM